MKIETKDLLELIFGRVDALDGYWNIYIAAIVGTLGFMASGKQLAKNPTVKTLIIFLFAIFAYSNWDAISAANDQRRELIDLLDKSSYGGIATATQPPDNWVLGLYHGVLDLLIIGTIWLAPWPEN